MTTRNRPRGEQPMVPEAEFRSYYGLPILKRPVWKAPDIAGYFFAGGLAGASSLLAAAAQLSGRPALASRTKLVAATAIAAGTVGLVHDLGKPGRFANMLRVFKPTSPMSVGSWLLAAYGPAAGVAAGTSVLGRWPRLGGAATASAALLGPLVATYTSALVADTAIPAWHGGRHLLPFAFAGSSAAAAGGLALALGSARDAPMTRRFALGGAAMEAATMERLVRRDPVGAEPYGEGVAGRYLDWARGLTMGGLALSLLARRNAAARVVGGLALAAGSACTRLGVLYAGRQSAADPRYVVQPQRERLVARSEG